MIEQPMKRSAVMCKSLLISVFLFLSAYALAGYASTNWQGKSINAAIQRYGQPLIVDHDANGSTIYVFQVPGFKNYVPPMTSNPTVIIGPRGQAIAASVPPVGSPQGITTIQCEATFVVSGAGIIQRARMRGAC
jgi:hypothetical protein